MVMYISIYLIGIIISIIGMRYLFPLNRKYDNDFVYRGLSVVFWPIVLPVMVWVGLLYLVGLFTTRNY